MRVISCESAFTRTRNPATRRTVQRGVDTTPRFHRGVCAWRRFVASTRAGGIYCAESVERVATGDGCWDPLAGGFRIQRQLPRIRFSERGILQSHNLTSHVHRSRTYRDPYRNSLGRPRTMRICSLFAAVTVVTR